MKTNPPNVAITLSSEPELRIAAVEIREHQGPKAGQLFSVTATLSMIATRPAQRAIVPNRDSARRKRILEDNCRLEPGMLLKGTASHGRTNKEFRFRTSSTLRPCSEVREMFGKRTK
jgi:hypothetical protein